MLEPDRFDDSKRTFRPSDSIADYAPPQYMMSQPLASVPVGSRLDALLEPRLSRSGERPPARRALAEWEKRESVAIDISRVVSFSSATRAARLQAHFSFRRFQVWPERWILRNRAGRARLEASNGGWEVALAGEATLEAGGASRGSDRRCRVRGGRQRASLRRLRTRLGPGLFARGG